MTKNHLIRWSVFFVCLLLYTQPAFSKTLSNPFYPKSRAVLIGVEEYRNPNWKKMITSIADAKGLEKFLRSRNFTIDTFYGRKATKKAIKNHFEEVLPKKCGTEDRVVIFISGHFYHRNLPGDKIISFFAPYGAKDLRVGTMISLKTIRDWCNDLKARHVFLVVNGIWDKFSEEIVEKRFWKPRSRKYYRAASRKKSRQIFTAGYPGESFSESGPSGTPYSLFAGNIITGMESETADLDSDGIIGVTELAAYIREKVYFDGRQFQKPVFGILEGDEGGDMIFLSRSIKSKNALHRALSETRGKLKVTSNVSGATIYIDNKPRRQKSIAGKAVSLEVGIGAHTIKISKEAYLDLSAKTFISYNKTHRVSFSMKKNPTLEIGYMIRIKGGEYTIGVAGNEHDDGPAHEVIVDDFFIGKYEITNTEYMRFVKDTGHSPPPCIDDKLFRGAEKPVVCVTWDDAISYCKWKSRITGKLYRLPTEAEWEIAARGHSGRKYPWGNQPPQQKNVFRANYETKQDGYACTAPVKSFYNGQTPNKIFNLGGNVYEWCMDWYDSKYYANSMLKRNPTGPEVDPSGFKTIRGGSWLFDEESIECTDRGQIPPNEIKSDVGFRVVMVPGK